jgi:hypothetical protein
MFKRFMYVAMVFFFSTCAKDEKPPVGTGVLNSIQTLDVNTITTNTAGSGGDITDNNGENITAKGICWNTTGSPSISNSKTVNGSGKQSYTSIAQSLLPSTTYYVRAYITSQSATAYGEEKTFKTKDVVVPTVTTNAVTNTTRTAATCGGVITSDGGGNITSKGVCWSTSQTPTTTNTKTSDGTGATSFTSQITNLLPNTTYYARAYAINQLNVPAYGAQVTITTLPLAPATLSTNVVSSIQYTTAVSGGVITDDGGGTITSKGVCWSTSHLPTINNSKTADGNGSGSFSSGITGLNSATTYYVRAYAINTNSATPAYGQEEPVTTKAYASPTLTVDNVDRNITNTSTDVTGAVTTDGGASVTQRGFCWGTSSNPTVNDFKTIVGSGLGSYSSTISGLAPGQLYFVRAYAINSGTSVPGYSTQTQFTTCNVTSATNASTYQFIAPGPTNFAYNGGSSFNYLVTLRNTSTLFGQADRIDLYNNETLVITLATNASFTNSNTYTVTIAKSNITAACCYTIRVKKGTQIYISPTFSITN